MSNMIVCPEPLAAKAGRDIFARGGNAMDAALAAAFVQGVTNPLLCGVGGTAVIHLYEAGKKRSVILNAEETVGSAPIPEHWARDCMGRSETLGLYKVPGWPNRIGYQSIMTPGFVRGCWVAYQRYASHRLSWAELLAPAIRLAREGFEVYPYIAAFWQSKKVDADSPTLQEKLQATADARRIYLKADGSPYEEGDRLVQLELAATLERLAEAGGDDFYTGQIARAISEDIAKHGGFVTAEDLRDFPVYEDQPLRASYRGLEVTAAPYGSGAQFIEMLLILEHFDLAGLRYNSPEYLDLLARVQRASFADNVPLRCLSREAIAPLERDLISHERAAYWADRIKSGDRINIRGIADDRGTTHLSCIDAERNVVCINHSIGAAGSGAITPGLGFLYNSDLARFNPLPGQPDSLVPGKKFFGGLPAILFRNGEPYMAIGAPGGNCIMTSVAQAVVNVVDFGMDMRTAVTAPRLQSEKRQLITLEPAFSESTAEALRAMGNEVERSTYQARVQAVLVRDDIGELEAGPDPRGGAGVGRHP